MPLNHEQVVDSTLATLSLLPAIKLACIRACTSHPSHTTHMHVATNRPYRTHPATPNESRKDASLLFGASFEDNEEPEGMEIDEEIDPVPPSTCARRLHSEIEELAEQKPKSKRARSEIKRRVKKTDPLTAKDIATAQQRVAFVLHPTAVRHEQDAPAWARLPANANIPGCGLTFVRFSRMVETIIFTKPRAYNSS